MPDNRNEVCPRGPLLGVFSGLAVRGSRPFRAWKGAIVPTLRPQGQVWIALAALVVAVGTLTTVVALEGHSITTGPTEVSAESSSVSDQLFSECGEDTKVFARPASYGDRVFVVDLPAGVHLAKLIAVGDIELGYASTYSKIEKRPVVTVRSWFKDT